MPSRPNGLRWCYQWIFWTILNIEGHTNFRIKKKVTAFFLNGCMLPIGGFTLGSVWWPKLYISLISKMDFWAIGHCTAMHCTVLIRRMLFLKLIYEKLKLSITQQERTCPLRCNIILQFFYNFNISRWFPFILFGIILYSLHCTFTLNPKPLTLNP